MIMVQCYFLIVPNFFTFNQTNQQFCFPLKTQPNQKDLVGSKPNVICFSEKNVSNMKKQCQQKRQTQVK
jgi:hypothetical protein